MSWSKLIMSPALTLRGPQGHPEQRRGVSESDRRVEGSTRENNLQITDVCGRRSGLNQISKPFEEYIRVVVVEEFARIQAGCLRALQRGCVNDRSGRIGGPIDAICSYARPSDAVAEHAENAGHGEGKLLIAAASPFAPYGDRRLTR